MTFSSVPEEEFLTDVLKTWLSLFASDPDFYGVDVTPKQPDVDKDFKLPALVLKRVSEEDWALTRLGGYHGDIIGTGSSERLSGYTYKATYQLDLLTKSIGEQLRYASLINKKLKSKTSADVFANNSTPVVTEITVKDFASPQNPEGTDTDLKIKFRFWRDVTSIEVPTFDPELHQHSIAINFWVDYLNGYSTPNISAIGSVNAENIHI